MFSNIIMDIEEQNLDEYYIVITDEKEKISLLKIAFGVSYVNYIWILFLITNAHDSIKPLDDLSFNVFTCWFAHNFFNFDVLIR